MKRTSKATNLAKLRAFLRHAYRRGWITENLNEKITTFQAVYEEKEPYTEEQIEAILTESLRMSRGTHGYASKPKTFRLLLELMLETGMRAGDAVQYDPQYCLKGEKLWIYTYIPQKGRRKTKQSKPVEAFQTEKLKFAIDRCEWFSSKLPFSRGEFENESYLANEVYARMQAIGDRCGVSDCRPHRLRDTFSVRCLLRGMNTSDLSRLLAHSSVVITEKYYARWVTDRKRRLERLVCEFLDHMPLVD
jgi:integrase